LNHGYCPRTGQVDSIDFQGATFAATLIGSQLEHDPVVARREVNGQAEAALGIIATPATRG
jgi:hypothetical protein